MNNKRLHTGSGIYVFVFEVFKWLKAFCLIHSQDLWPNSSGCNPHRAAVGNKSELFLLLSQRWVGLSLLFLWICPRLADRLVVPLSPRVLRIYVAPVSLLDCAGVQIRSEKGKRREVEKRGAGGGEMSKYWQGGRRMDFLRIRYVWQLWSFLLPLHLPHIGPSNFLDLLLSFLAQRSLVKVLPPCPWYSGACFLPSRPCAWRS